MKTKSYILKFFGIALLLGSGSGLWYLQSNLQDEIQQVTQRLADKTSDTWTASVPVGSTKPSFELAALNGDVISSDKLNAQLTLLVFFSPDDCSACLLEAKLWRTIDQTYLNSEVMVLGITKAPVDNYKMTIFKRGKGIDFPILLDLEGQYTSRFGITNTPSKVIIDKSGKILDASASGQSLVEHKFFKAKIARLLKMSSENLL